MKSKMFNEKLDDELYKATIQHGKFNSLHEGIAVLREEYLELEKEVFVKTYSKEKIMNEALQVSAMAKKLYLFAEEL